MESYRETISSKQIPSSDTMTVIVLDRVSDIPQEQTDYCIHGQATCVNNCGHWVWLGHASVDVVQKGEAVPICKPCATAMLSGGEGTPAGNVLDHRRADGPHE